ncbi:TDG/mug DNA glycosylase family protein [Pontibacter aydingkolensis]|uniref:G/U mismatch-specific DNA glycosylase n=1 Tax=Pontibacter aydingkolensis TaxID=1911536 RepID=A0ABS7CTA9_9BACT|nr:G/U mismatch-specific DNA glycosylase [Pontibacter aydingkolensis]MBW7466921.1 G/U mismatch-specific DNA glycosylase [Pontibacter aydingkolensis]
MQMLKRPTKDQLAAASGQIIPDIIAPDLKVLFCGINPGLYTAFSGHNFARPGNRFWPALHAAGFTPRQFRPEEDEMLLELGYGITNIVDRATGSAAELSSVELIEGGINLVEKVIEYQPQVLALLGISAYRVAFGKASAVVGLQEQVIGNTKLWVLPNPSGLNAHFPPKELHKVYKKLREYIDGNTD